MWIGLTLMFKIHCIDHGHRYGSVSRHRTKQYSKNAAVGDHRHIHAVVCLLLTQSLFFFCFFPLFISMLIRRAYLGLYCVTFYSVLVISLLPACS
jgi:hypothetical protein